MASRTSVVDISGGHEETIQRLARQLGKDKLRRRLFEEVYGRVRKFRSKKEIMTSAGIESRQSQQTQNQLEYLANHHLIARVENDGTVQDGSQFLYGKDEVVRPRRQEIVKYADKPNERERIPTKRDHAKRTIVSSQRFSPKVLRSKKKLKILYLTADPGQTIRLDTEVRGVQDAIRGSKLRDNIDLIALPAATSETLVNGLNDHAPRVIHFSGHGGSDGIAMAENSFKKSKSKLIGYELLAKSISATDKPPDIVILCSCDGANAVKEVLPTAKAVIIMSDSISDLAASSFACSFYAAIASGQSLKSAFAQGTNGILFETLDEDAIPQLHVRSGIDAAKLVLA